MGENKLRDKERKKVKFQSKTPDKGSNVKWVVLIFVLSFIISSTIGYVSDIFLGRVDIFIAFIILIVIILIGIIFDIIGMAVATADETPFHSMASKKIKGSKISVVLIRNAGKVSTFCNDVIGDICGIISGTTGAVIVVKIISSTTINNATILTLIISGIIASLTVGGKAIGKIFAISKSNSIVYNVAWVLESFMMKK
ncbi:hypothetical protein [Clostridium cylindrosporum]|uniref:hypothetical protein n=1 Tax=Clostridium cylindrosporum TaxID=1495 RepID=UPI00065C909B|nr:hypothetical protein [Clostridium cylindrosporum]